MSDKEYMECSVVAYPREIKFLHINGSAISYYVDRHISDYVDRLQKENQELKRKLNESIHKATEFESEVYELKKQLEERPKEYVFIGNAQNKTRDFINQIIKDNKEFKNQQKEFINYLEKEIKRINPNDLYISELNLRLDDIKFTQYLIYKETLQKYKEITGVSDENNMEKSK